MNNRWGFLILAALLAGSVAGFFYLKQGKKSGQPAVYPVEARPSTEPEKKPSDLLLAPGAELPAQAGESKPLPTLAEADKEVTEWLAQLFPPDRLDKNFILDHLVERFVVLVNNLKEPFLPLAKIPVESVSGRFLVRTENEKIFISPENYRRYDPLVRLAVGISPDTAFTAYSRLYPLLQQASEELGISSPSFHQRLLEVIDHLLATPEVKEPIPLVQPHVLYQFADPELEALSSGQKILLRIGPKNAALVKEKLRELRAKLVR